MSKAKGTREEYQKERIRGLKPTEEDIVIPSMARMKNIRPLSTIALRVTLETGRGRLVIIDTSEQTEHTYEIGGEYGTEHEHTIPAGDIYYYTAYLQRGNKKVDTTFHEVTTPTDPEAAAAARLVLESATA